MKSGEPDLRTYPPDASLRDYTVVYAFRCLLVDDVAQPRHTSQEL